MALNISEDALVRRGLAAQVVRRLQAVDRDHKLQVRQRGSGQGNGTERAGHNLYMCSFDQFRQEDVEFPVANKWVAPNEREVERLMFIHQIEDLPDQFLPFEIGQTA